MLQEWANRLNLANADRTKAFQLVDSAFQPVLDHLRAHQERALHIALDDYSKDPVLSKLELLIAGKVGQRPDPEDLESFRKEAKRRIEQRQPPGYMDVKKGDERSYGDCLLWLESLAESKRRNNQHLVIVTDDVKEDWWRIENGQKRGPRPELALEARSHHRAELFIMRPESLLEHAQAAFDVRLHGETLSQVTSASTANGQPVAIGWTASTASLLMTRLQTQAPVQYAVLLAARSSGGFVARDAVYRLGDYDSSRTLRGFTRPVRRLMQQLQDENLLAESAPEPLTAVYDPRFDQVNASGFRVPQEFLEALTNGQHPARTASQCQIVSVNLLREPTTGDCCQFAVESNLGVNLVRVSGSTMAQAYRHSIEQIVARFAEERVPKEGIVPGGTVPEVLLAEEATRIDQRIACHDKDGA